MKTTTMIALIAVVSAVSVGAISMNTSSSAVLASGAISPEAGTMMGHVEYVVRDSAGNIKEYKQLDNMVVNKGDDCIIAYAFGTGATGDQCTVTGDGFRFIGISNATFSVVAASTSIGASGTGTEVATAQAGIMAMKEDTDTVQASGSSDGATVVISTETPFTFVDGAITNATTVRAAGLFDATCTTVEASSGRCTANGTLANMFAAQDSLNVVVGDGDSLDVTWTITVGNSS